MKQIFSFLVLFVLLAGSARANNIQTSGVLINGQNTTSHFSLINYGITWENSWRTSTNESNYDGAWIFAKFRKKNGSNWQHATINYVAPGTAAACGHTQATGSTIKTSADGKGVWMYRASNGTGTVNWAGNKLRWNYGADGVSDVDSVEIRLFAVEMVYVPTGAYNLGSGGTENYHFQDGAVDTYFPVTSENAITCGNAAGNLYTSSNGAYWFTGTLPAAFPKGYSAFWMMKYEFSQQQYIDFLNSIDYNKYVNRNPYSGAYTAGTHPNLTAVNPERAMGYIGCLDMLSWLDWAAMRPFTEMEYEKACRGANQVPIANEYPWGNTTITAIGTVTNQGTSTETWAAGNCNFQSPTGGEKMRSGALATSTSNRVSSGASYYGIMELGGNLWEWVITGAVVEGQDFTGAHGDGNLDATGTYNTLNWPTTGGSGLGMRGGAVSVMSPGFCVTSERYYGSYIYTAKSSSNLGGRGARTGE